MMYLMNTLPSQLDAERGAFSSFEACRNTQKGPVVILASGASAKHFPMGEFAHLPVIAMNGSIALTAASGVKPFFYVCTDKSFRKQQPALFAQATRDSERLALWPEQFANADLPSATQCFPLRKAEIPGLLTSLRGHDASHVCSRASWSKRARSIAFSKDLSTGFYDARTVAYVALQLAYHLGFEQVLLVGRGPRPVGGAFLRRGRRRGRTLAVRAGPALGQPHPALADLDGPGSGERAFSRLQPVAHLAHTASGDPQDRPH